MNIDIFSNQTLFELSDYLFSFIQIKITIQKGITLKDIIYQKVLPKIIALSSEKNGYYHHLKRVKKW